MPADPTFERRLERLVRTVLDAESGPDTTWATSPAARRVATSTRTRPRRWPLRILALAAVLVVGGAVVAGLVASRPPDPTALDRLTYALDGDIYVAGWDGSDPVRVADGLPDGRSGCGPAGYRSPTWSPDGRYLATRPGFDQVSCAASATVEISDPDGHVVASFPGDGWAIAWSPDSTRVATWVDVDMTAIGVFGLDGTREASLSLPDGWGIHKDEDAYWSPDGGSLLISLRPDPGAGPRRIWELPLDGGTPRPVPPDDPRSHGDATWSADGSRVAYTVSDTTEAIGQSLVVAAADGSQARVVVPPVGGRSYPRIGLSYPVMSPTGDRVAFSVGNVGTPDELRLVDVATGAVTSLADGAVEAITFSSDGDRVLFRRFDDDERSLWGVDTDGSGARLLVAGTYDGAWQPIPSGAIPSPTALMRAGPLDGDRVRRGADG